MVQLFLHDRRLELPPDVKLFEREIEREFPEVRRVVDEHYGALAKANAAIDAVFEHDAVWPPGTFWERRETARLVSSLPYAQDDLARLADELRPPAFVYFRHEDEATAPAYAERLKTLVANEKIGPPPME